MPGDHFWLCVEALAATFDGDHKAAEENLSIYETHALTFSRLRGVRNAAINWSRSSAACRDWPRD